ncbi:FecR domain-containing protein [Cytophagaceae bacterium YF14B1]|uniref:FecR domain-containing protein n=1 Tax=Xanthocytophaga flava TaxID=3048013 RepID=A0AAE3QV18_9BACT|nr:FecR domain-containing protein [Xanthocytophaga flavus]MDJ1483309.1 FecR domain-containing protein [Xanthocytophaga flavus]
MTEEYIQQLAQKFLNGTATEQEKQLLHTWYDHKTSEAEESEVFLNQTSDELKQRIHTKLKTAGMETDTHSPVKRLPVRYIRKLSLWSGIAAAFVVIIFWFSRQTTPQIKSTTKIIQVPLAQTQKLKLSDGSTIWLNAGSKLSYPDSFAGKTREVVLLEGQAFFDIAHRTDKPFIVHAKTLDITVFGTSFDVKAYEKDATIKVSVRTGKVGVQLRENPEKPAQIVLPAEQVVLVHNTDHMQVVPISKPAIAPWKENRLIFEDETLPEVFFALERKYKQHILIKNPDLLTEKITITLDNQPMEDVLKVLSFSKKFNYSQVNDTTIVIK